MTNPVLRTNLIHTAYTLFWDISCPNASRTHARITFDTNHHYTGRADIQEHLKGKLVHYIVQTEGQRQSACTTAADE